MRNYVLLLTSLCFLSFAGCSESPKNISTFNTNGNSAGNTNAAPDPAPATGSLSKLTPGSIEAEIIGRKLTSDAVYGGTWEFNAREPREIEILEVNEASGQGTVYVKIATCDLYSEVGYGGKVKLRYEKIAGEWNLSGIENVNFGITQDTNEECKKYFASKRTPLPTPVPATPRPQTPSPTPNRSPTPNANIMKMDNSNGF